MVCRSTCTPAPGPTPASRVSAAHGARACVRAGTDRCRFGIWVSPRIGGSLAGHTVTTYQVTAWTGGDSHDGGEHDQDSSAEPGAGGSGDDRRAILAVAAAAVPARRRRRAAARAAEGGTFTVSSLLTPAASTRTCPCSSRRTPPTASPTRRSSTSVRTARSCPGWRRAGRRPRRASPTRSRTGSPAPTALR